MATISSLRVPFLRKRDEGKKTPMRMAAMAAGLMGVVATAFMWGPWRRKHGDLTATG